MTTQVTITIEQEHMPVLVQVTEHESYLLKKKGDKCSVYVHQFQSATIREIKEDNG